MWEGRVCIYSKEQTFNQYLINPAYQSFNVLLINQSLTTSQEPVQLMHDFFYKI